MSKVEFNNKSEDHQTKPGKTLEGREKNRKTCVSRINVITKISRIDDKQVKIVDTYSILEEKRRSILYKRTKRTTDH